MTPAAMAKVGTILTFAVVLLLIIEGRSFTWLAPPVVDARLYAYIGNAWRHGNLPYLHAWELKPPGIFAVNAAASAFLPYSFGALAVAESVVLLGCAVTLYLLLREWEVSQTGRCLGVLLFAIASNLTISHANLPEIYLFWPATLSMLFFSRGLRESRPMWIFLSGLSAGLGSLFKITGLDPLVAQSAYLFVLWFVFRRLSVRRVVDTIAIAAAGASLAWLPVGLYFGFHGALSELLEVSFIDPFYFSAAIPKSLGRYTFMIFYFLRDLYPLIIFILIGFGAYLVELRLSFHDPRPDGNSRLRIGPVPILAGLWVAVDLLGALAGNRSQTQYFLPLALSIAAMAGVTYTQQVEKTVLPMHLRSTLLALLIVPLTVTNFNNEFRELVHVVRYGHLLSHDLDLGHDQVPMEQQLRQVGTFIGGVRGKDDTLFSWDLQPWLFQMLDMKSSIYVLDMGFRRQLPRKARLRFVENALNQLQSNPPTFIVDSTEDAEGARREDPLYRTFEQFVDQRYECLKEFRLNHGAKFRVYRSLSGY